MIQYIANLTKWQIFAVLDVQLCSKASGLSTHLCRVA